ncbi:MAG TPA: YgiQ family radical SAM protein [Planctomycetota bacterium]|nr:YgiQ family radical SAM protein [Planctomycetota bacterium]
MSRAEMDRLGWTELDVLLVSGDAYVDHPSFGAALLGRWLVSNGFRTGIVAQPRWTGPDDLKVMGRPRLAAGVTAGALDSMLAHYTAFRKKRREDAYTPGGLAGARPNRACLVYAGLVKQAFPGLPVLLGGVEASLRRITHYDFWTDRLHRPILLDAKADVLLYGMAERGLLEVCRRLDAGRPPADPAVPGAAYIGSRAALPAGAEVVELPSHEEMLADPSRLLAAALAIERQVHQARAWAVQPVGGRALVLTPPGPLETAELDRLYALPFTREPHPAYAGRTIPAADMIRASITSHRGCGGGCSFCTLSAHQGRTVRSRSADSIVAEAAAMAAAPGFSGSISDVGGPTANMWGAVCTGDPGRCRRSSCLFPDICPRFAVDQMSLIGLLRRVGAVRGVKHVRVASGIRHDLALKDERYIRAMVRDFVGGQLKIAPEHLADEVLRLMRKPGAGTFERFLGIFDRESAAAGKRQFLVPYLISAFPGCTPAHMEALARWLAGRNWRPEQVQCFIPLPGTVAAAMYWAGTDPDGRRIPMARTDAERLALHGLLRDGERPGRPGRPNRPRRAGKGRR